MTSRDKSSRASLSNHPLYGFNILTKYPKKEQLVPYLRELHEHLGSVEQDVQSAPRGLPGTITHLLTPKLLENSDKEIRVLVACCVVDVLRIYAPESPCKDSDMIRVFDMLIAQMRGLQTMDPTSALGKHMVYILNSLATVKSCVVPVIMAQSNIAGAGELVESMFETIINTVRPEHDEEIILRFSEILHACIAEYEGVSDELLGILLQPLLPASKSDNPTAFKVCAVVISAVAPLIRKTVAEVVKNILVGSSSRLNGKLSEIAEDIYPLIYELHRIAPDILGDVIPNLCVQLRVEEENIRHNAVKLLCSLFTSDKADYARDFPRDFKDFLGRLNDLSYSIRDEMLECCGTLLRNKPDMSYVEEMVAKRLRDPIEDIRLKALKKLLEYAHEHISIVSLHTMSEIADRAKDKKIEIRKLALEGLAKMYYRYIASKLLPISAIEFEGPHSLHENITPTMMDRLNSVPGAILKSWGFPEISSRHLCVQLIQEYILPKPSKYVKEVAAKESVEVSKDSEQDEEINISEQRTTALLVMFAMLDHTDKMCFTAMLGQKAKVHEQLDSFLNIKLLKGSDIRLSGAADNSEDQSIIFQMKQALFSLTQQLPPIDKKNVGFEKLLGSRDRTIFKLIGTCVGSIDDIDKAIKNRDDLQRRLDSKSPLGEYFSMVYDFAGSMICNNDMLESMLSLLVKVGSEAVAVPIAEVVNFMARFCPKLCVSSSSNFIGWLDMAVPLKSDKGKLKQTKSSLFDTFHNSLVCCGRYLQDERKTDLATSLVKLLNDVEDADLCYRIAEILCHVSFCQPTTAIDASTVHVTTAFVKKCCAKSCFTLKNPRLLCNLHSLLALTTIPNVVYESLAGLKSSTDLILTSLHSAKHSLIEFLLTGVLQEDEAPIELRCASLKLWANILCCDSENYIFRKEAKLHEKSSGSTSDSSHGSRPEIDPLISVVFGCLETSGEVLAGMNLIDKDEQLAAYFTAAWCGVQLMRVRTFGDNISAVQWQELAWSMLVENRVMKKQLLVALVSVIQTHPVHIKFLSLPCLFANEAEGAESAQKGLLFAIKRLRKTQEELGTKIINEKDEKKRAKYQRTAIFTMPEMIMPYLLHLLSYHPEFPSSVAVDTEEDKRKMKVIIRCVQCLLSALQSTLRNETGNLPYLFKQLNTINRSYVDRLDPENIGVHFVTRLTVKLLNEQVKTAENVQVYPGDITLPPDLYVSSIDGVAQAQFGTTAKANASVHEGLEVAENAINKILNITAKSRSNNRAIPISSPVAAKKNRSPAASAEKVKMDRRNVAEEFEEEEHLPKKKTKQPNDSKPAKVVEKVVASRVMPKRSVKASVSSYVEVEENDEEVEQWHEQAGSSRRSSRSSSNHEVLLSPIQAASSSTTKASTTTSSSKRKIVSTGNRSDEQSSEWSLGDENPDNFEPLIGTKRKLSTTAGRVSEIVPVVESNNKPPKKLNNEQVVVKAALGVNQLPKPVTSSTKEKQAASNVSHTLGNSENEVPTKTVSRSSRRRS